MVDEDTLQQIKSKAISELKSRDPWYKYEPVEYDYVVKNIMDSGITDLEEIIEIGIACKKAYDRAGGFDGRVRPRDGTMGVIVDQLVWKGRCEKCVYNSCKGYLRDKYQSWLKNLH